MQRDFVETGAPLCVAGAAETIDAIAALAEFARSSGWIVIHIVRAHKADGSDAEMSRRYLFEQGEGYCVKGTPGAQCVWPLRPHDGDIVVEKTRFSGFFRTELDDILDRYGIREIVIAGTQYPNCIRATAVDALSRDYHVSIATDCCSAQTKSIADYNLRDMESMGIRCVTSGEMMMAVSDRKDSGC